jgi:hypothetical protein
VPLSLGVLPNDLVVCIPHEEGSLEGRVDHVDQPLDSEESREVFVLHVIHGVRHVHVLLHLFSVHQLIMDDLLFLLLLVHLLHYLLLLGLFVDLLLFVGLLHFLLLEGVNDLVPEVLVETSDLIGQHWRRSHNYRVETGA